MDPTPPPYQLGTTSTSSTSNQKSLRDFFADLLKSATPRQTTNQPQKRLTGLGESLTSDEAMDRVRKAQEEKEQTQQRECKKKKGRGT